ncbi:NYN domain-containing protein [Novosphingobium tardum]|uniref:NYN domain-containing protein n=1 Tax=Novosphingobium tardum TaxID=1538021 RepID=A0ABV8RP57_9SPHN
MDDLSPPLRNIALLIDADNTSPAGIDPVLTVMAELGQVNIRRAYGNFAKQGLSKWDKITNRFGIRPHQQFDVSKGKNATDMAMTIDAIDLLYQGKVDGFGIMSSDSDFTPLVSRLRQDGIVVYGFGSSKTPEAFRTACTRFIDVDALIANDAADNGGRQESEPPQKLPVEEELNDLLGAAWKASKRDEEGFAALSEMGNIAGNRSSFDVRNYGYKRLSDLLKDSTRFKVERREDKQLYVKRLR